MSDPAPVAGPLTRVICSGGDGLAVFGTYHGKFQVVESLILQNLCPVIDNYNDGEALPSVFTRCFFDGNAGLGSAGGSQVTLVSCRFSDAVLPGFPAGFVNGGGNEANTEYELDLGVLPTMCELGWVIPRTPAATEIPATPVKTPLASTAIETALESEVVATPLETLPPATPPESPLETALETAFETAFETALETANETPLVPIQTPLQTAVETGSETPLVAIATAMETASQTVIPGTPVATLKPGAAGLGPGAIAGISVGAVVGVGAIVTAVILVLRHTGVLGGRASEVAETPVP